MSGDTCRYCCSWCYLPEHACAQEAIALRQRVKELEAAGKPSRFESNADDLTPRERQILRYIAHSLTNKVIAQELQLSIHTIEKHREHLMAKLDIHDVAGLTRYVFNITI